jgi:hypothetical protein
VTRSAGNGAALARVVREFAEAAQWSDRDAVLDRTATVETHEGVLEAGLRQRKGKAFFLALGLRFGQAGNSGLVQTFRPWRSPSPPRPSGGGRCSASRPSRWSPSSRAGRLAVYSLITLVSAALAPEVRGRDLVRLEDAA